MWPTNQNLQGTGITVNSLWPATAVESFATKNFQMGDESSWRKAGCLCLHAQTLRLFTCNAVTAGQHHRRCHAAGLWWLR